MKIESIIVSIALILSVTSCASWRLSHDVPVVQEQKQKLIAELKAQSVPTPVSEDILSYLQPQSKTIPTQYSKERFQVTAQEVPAREFFGSLIEETPYNIAIHPGVTGAITLALKSVTLDEVLTTVSDLYGYDIREKNKVIHIYPAELRTEYFSLNYLTFVREGRSRTSVSAGRLSDADDSDSESESSDSSSSDTGSSINSTFIETSSTTDFWVEIGDALRTLVPSGNGRAVTMSSQAGIITVRAYPSELRSVREFLDNIEQRMHRQVALEARILEVTLDQQYEQGIQWDKIAQTNGLSIESLVNLPTVANDVATSVGGGVKMTVKKGNFSAIVQLLGSQGHVNTLSSPRVTAVNNQKAVIKVGTDEYFVTDVSTTTVTGTSTTSTPDVELTPFFSGIALDITPQIDSNKHVLLHVHPSVIDIEEQTKTIDLGSFGSSSGTNTVLELPLARSSIRESDMVVRVPSGDIVIIGGLMKQEQQLKETEVPFLSQIPGVGEIFKNRREVSEKIELVILLRPTVISRSEDWNNLMQESLQQLHAQQVR